MFEKRKTKYTLKLLKKALEDENLNEDIWKVRFKQCIKNWFGEENEYFYKAKNLSIYLDNSDTNYYSPNGPYDRWKSRKEAGQFIDMCISGLSFKNKENNEKLSFSLKNPKTWAVIIPICGIIFSSGLFVRESKFDKEKNDLYYQSKTLQNKIDSLVNLNKHPKTLQNKTDSLVNLKKH